VIHRQRVLFLGLLQAADVFHFFRQERHATL